MFEGLGFLDTLDTPTSKLTMPIGALFTAVFIGWIADKRLVDAENGLSGGLHYLWRFLVRWFCPLALLLILLGGIFPDRAAQLFAALGGGEVQSGEVAE
jgi:NSS family neurotransmitter:Na+ symporter